ncbi:hypothetical protein G9A89_016218 [Geosiphon pyriformis]|nr:hypothetical protein G9A89_016218 [Geosiphon pyriformis]
MSFPTNTENILTYPEPMQADLLNEQDTKLLTDWFNTLATEEPPVAFGGPSQTLISSSRGHQPGYGAAFEAVSPSYTGANGFIYPIAPQGITISNTPYGTQNFQNGSQVMHNAFVPAYPIMSHQLGPPIHNTNGFHHVVNGNGMGGGKGKLLGGGPMYIKTEPSIHTRRKHSISSSSIHVRGSLSSSKNHHSPKRSNSARRPAKNSIDNNTSNDNNPLMISNENRLDEMSSTLNISLQQQQQQQVSSSSSNTLESAPVASSSNVDIPSSPKLDSQGETSSNPTTSSNRGGRGKKVHHELLTEAEKKANHIASEQKRRQNIRMGFDQLVEIVPTLSQCHRSEALILQKSVEYIQQLLIEKSDLKDRVKSLQATLGDGHDHLNDSSSDGELDLIF